MKAQLRWHHAAAKNFYKAGRRLYSEPMRVKEIVGRNRYTGGMYSYLEFESNEDRLAFILRWSS